MCQSKGHRCWKLRTLRLREADVTDLPCPRAACLRLGHNGLRRSVGARVEGRQGSCISMDMLCGE